MCAPAHLLVTDLAICLQQCPEGYYESMNITCISTFACILMFNKLSKSKSKVKESNYIYIYKRVLMILSHYASFTVMCIYSAVNWVQLMNQKITSS
jgi:hypothetical protein